MAKEQRQTEPQPLPDEEPIVQQESEYTVDELAGAAEAVFGAGTMPECVIAAFRVAGIKKATKSAAKEIVTKFMTKEVK